MRKVWRGRDWRTKIEALFELPSGAVLLECQKAAWSHPLWCLAHNINGCTLHSLLDVNVNFPNANLSEVKRKQLLARLKHPLMLAIDKCSQLDFFVVAPAERNMRRIVYNEQNNSKGWCAILVVLVFGNDFQLPPFWWCRCGFRTTNHTVRETEIKPT